MWGLSGVNYLSSIVQSAPAPTTSSVDKKDSISVVVQRTLQVALKYFGNFIKYQKISETELRRDAKHMQMK